MQDGVWVLLRCAVMVQAMETTCVRKVSAVEIDGRSNDVTVVQGVGIHQSASQHLDRTRRLHGLATCGSYL